MNDPDVTMPILKAKLTPDEVTATQAGALMAAGAGVFDTEQAPPRIRGWEPPSVEALQKLLPQYEVTAFIARGGMGAVYKGTQRALKRAVAIKVLPPEIQAAGDDMQFAARFKLEAQAMAQLSHPNIVAVFDAGETPDGLLYFVMEFVEGTDVAQLIQSEGRIHPQRAVPIIVAVCQALAFAHDEGIVHRDIKPSNVMIDKWGRVKVADFGLAKTANLESTFVTRSDVAMGTPDFAAPEAQIPGMKVDGRADLYAVGVMLYQMLTGKIPRGRFELPSGVVPQIDKAFDAIVDRALQTDREKRYSTAQEMKQAVERIDSSGIRPPADALPDGPKPTQRSKKPFLLGAAATIILGVSTWFLIHEPTAGQKADEKIAKPVSQPGQWEKLWPPEEYPHEWKEGAMLLNASVRSKSIQCRNLAMRAAFKISKDAKEPSEISIRVNGTNRETESRLYLTLEPALSKTLLLKTRQTGNQTQLLQKWDLGTTLKDGDWAMLEICAVDDLITVSANGRRLGSTRSQDVMAQGEMLLYSKNALVRDIAYLNLDGLSVAEARKAAGLEEALPK